MGQGSVTIKGFQSFNPYIDPRVTGQLAVIAGKNFAWDAKGPYSAFSSRLLDVDTIIDTAPHVTQGLDLHSVQFVATLTKVKQWDSVTGWDDILSLGAVANPFSVPLNNMRWSTAYLAAGSYACSPLHGFFRLDAGPSLTQLDSGDIPGFPASPIAICETNGRLIIIDADWVYWSGPNDPENLTPAIGGPGAQKIAARVPGIPLTVTPIPVGCIVWTDKAAMICEFIGGANVFRFYPMTTRVLPLGAFGIEALPDGSHAIISRMGLYRTVNGAQPEALTPLFNEYLRELFRYNDSIEVVMYYSLDENRLYVSLRDSTAVFTTTFVLDIAIDRWGLFTPEHLGIFKYDLGRGNIGYTDRDGVGHRFLSYLMQGRNRELAAAPGTYAGLDSYVEIGYLHPDGTPTGDSILEIQDALVTRDDIAASIQTVDEGLLSEAVTATVDEGLLTDPVDVEVDESLEGVLLGVADYSLIFKGDTFAFDDTGSSDTIPELVERYKSNDLWSGVAAGEYLRLRFEANNDGEYYHVSVVRATLAYNGELA
jgi:hypothetical protein